uniref:VQ domain-containing protein n=1 Tax=Oryza punctata TaxID=4537 RepID=A0A0E0LDK1_ORYPU
MGECSYNSMSPSTPLPAPAKKGSPDAAVHKERPKIRIIHIIAPEIIKTDVASFRDLVQRLTGKQQQQQETAETLPPTSPVAVLDEKEKEKVTTKKRPPPAAAAAEEESELVQQESMRKKNKKIKCEVKVEERGFGYDHLDHTDLWMDLNPGGFLSFLEEEDVFQGMVADLFQSPLGSSRMDFVGEMYAS